MAGGDNVVYLEAGRTSARGAAVLEELESFAGARLMEALRGALDEVDDALFHRAERAGSNNHQESYFVAMRQIRLNRAGIERSFADDIAARFAGLTVSPAKGDAAASSASREAGELELMAEAAVEEDVAVDTLASRLASRHAYVLAQFTTRLDALVGERSVTEDSNPAGPRAVADAFRASLATVEIDIQPRIIVYKLFEKSLLTRYGALCEALNARLLEAGVLPDLRLGVKSSAPAPQDDAPTAGSPHASGGGEPLLEEADGERVLRSLRELIARARGAGQPGTAEAPQDYGPVDDVGDGLADLVSVLSSFQSATARSGASVAVNPQRLKTLVTRGLEKRGSDAGIGRAADDTIDIVSMLFEVILDDDRLHGSIKALIARLQIPVLKVALVDRDFFASRQHPARQLINELARAAVGWNEPEDPASDALYREMTAVVETVIDEFVDDVTVFRDALRDFRHYLEKEEARAQVIEERTRQAAEGKARVEDAREQVRLEIERRLAGDGTPAVVRTLLEEAWFRVLFITAVKEGVDGPLWERQLAVMDRLVWSVSPKVSADDRRRMLNEMPTLLSDLREGLNAIMYNPFEMTRLFGELEAEHLRILAAPPGQAPDATPAAPVPAASAQPPSPDAAEPGDMASAEDSAPAELDPDDGPTATASATGAGRAEHELQPESGEQRLDTAGSGAPAETARDGFRPLDPETWSSGSLAEDAFDSDELVQRLRAIELGTWFELTDTEGRENRAKLSARLNRGRRFVFVNRAGFKVADRPIEALLADLREGRATILDDNTLFDRALESVIGSLRDLRAGQEH